MTLPTFFLCEFLDAPILSHDGLVQKSLSSYLPMAAAQPTRYQGPAMLLSWMGVLHLAPQASRH